MNGNDHCSAEVLCEVNNAGGRHRGMKAAEACKDDGAARLSDDGLAGKVCKGTLGRENGRFEARCWCYMRWNAWRSRQTRKPRTQ